MPGGDYILNIVCKHINNYFHIRNGFNNGLGNGSRQIVADYGEFTIEDGIIEPVSDMYQPSQFIRIVGSLFNDGVFQIERVGDGYIDIALHSEDYPQWQQPTVWPDTTYRIGDRVTHNGIRWVSLVDSNQWEPGTEPWAWEKVAVVEHSLRDEIFYGAVAPLNIPRDFLSLIREIERFQNASGDPSERMYTSQSVGSWSGSRATDRNGMIAGWQSVFAVELNKYRRMFPEVVL